MQKTNNNESLRIDLDSLWARGCEFLGCKYAILGGAKSWVSEKNLVSAISEAGGFGVIACGSMGPNQLASEIRGTNERTSKPFGVNLIVMHPELDNLVDTCIYEGVKHVVLAGGMPPRSIINKLNAEKIPNAIYYRIPLHLQKVYKKLNHKEGDLQISEDISSRIISLPMHPYLKVDEIDKVCNVILD